MYENFTDRSRYVFKLANKKAQQFGHDHIGTEHILLGLIEVDGGGAAYVLKNLDIDLPKIRLETEKRLPVRSKPSLIKYLPMSPPTKSVLEFAIKEAEEISQGYVGTEHILLGLLAQEGASKVLIDLGLTLATARVAVLSMYGRR